MKIIVGVDDSPFSAAALEYVRTHEWSIGSRLIVVSVAELQVMSYTEVYAGAVRAFERAMQKRKQALGVIVARAELSLRDRGLRTESRVLEGDPCNVLIEVAKRENADLIVVGSHGRTGLNRLLVGSVASHVVTHAPCSVLVVRQRSRP